MVPDQNGYNGPHHHGFPYREVIILVLCVSVHAYTLVNVFPYVGVMVMQLMDLKSINDAGETRTREGGRGRVMCTNQRGKYNFLRVHSTCNGWEPKADDNNAFIHAELFT